MDFLLLSVHTVDTCDRLRSAQCPNKNMITLAVYLVTVPRALGVAEKEKLAHQLRVENEKCREILRVAQET